MLKYDRDDRNGNEDLLDNEINLEEDMGLNHVISYEALSNGGLLDEEYTLVYTYGWNDAHRVNFESHTDVEIGYIDRESKVHFES